MLKKQYIAAALLTLLGLYSCAIRVEAQEAPYFTTYDHHLEEPGDLESETSLNFGHMPAGQNNWVAPWNEFEYGVNGWWTSEIYLDAMATQHDSTIFTGWRWENRFRLLQSEHKFNPVLYLEWGQLNEADNILTEAAGHSSYGQESNAVLRAERVRELETRFILSSNFGNWNVAENFIAEKNFAQNEGIEFGYALGVSRQLGGLASGRPCLFCPENFDVGLEALGGLGSTLGQDGGFGFRHTAQYIAPLVAWKVSPNARISIEPGFGLTHESVPFFLKLRYSYEFEGFGPRLMGWFRGDHPSGSARQ